MSPPEKFSISINHVTPNTHSDSDYDADDIKKRYLTDSTTIDSDSDSDS